MPHPWRNSLGCITIACTIADQPPRMPSAPPPPERCQVIGPLETLRRAIGVAHEVRKQGSETTTIRAEAGYYVRSC